MAAVIADETGESHVPHSTALLRFVDAVLAGEAAELLSAREVVLETVGAAAFVDVCATVASFNAVVKIADGSGIPLEAAKAERTRELRAELGIDRLRSS